VNEQSRLVVAARRLWAAACAADSDTKNTTATILEILTCLLADMRSSHPVR